ncbi:MAG: hypothetical protein F6K20_37100 [Moorea sp. SIO2C4]|nr:hypothetical protein [Moorena sp. SIO2C4]
MRYAHAWPWPLATLREWPRSLRCEQLSACRVSAHGLCTFLLMRKAF